MWGQQLCDYSYLAQAEGGNDALAGQREERARLRLIGGAAIAHHTQVAAPRKARTRQWRCIWTFIITSRD
jgi:hypothetical protein